MEEWANQWKQDDNRIMDKDANPSVTTVTNLDTQQRIADNQRERRSHKDVSNAAKKNTSLQGAKHLNK